MNKKVKTPGVDDIIGFMCQGCRQIFHFDNNPGIKLRIANHPDGRIGGSVCSNKCAKLLKRNMMAVSTKGKVWIVGGREVI